MWIWSKIFGKSVKQVREEAVCYICSAPSYYKCDVCGKYTCMKHTAPGTQTCVECQARRGGLGRLTRE